MLLHRRYNQLCGWFAESEVLSYKTGLTLSKKINKSPRKILPLCTLCFTDTNFILHLQYREISFLALSGISKEPWKSARSNEVTYKM